MLYIFHLQQVGRMTFRCSLGGEVMILLCNPSSAKLVPGLPFTVDDWMSPQKMARENRKEEQAAVASGELFQVDITPYTTR